MADLTVSYPLSTSLNGSATSGFAASAITKASGVSYADIFESKLLVQPGVTTVNVARYVEFTITPDDDEWQPGLLTLTMARRNASGTVRLQVRTSADGYASTIGTEQTATSSAVKVIDLSGLGTVSGPLTIRLLVAAPVSPNGIFISDLSLTGTYTPAGAVDQTLEPTGIASAEAFGDTVVVVVQPVDLSPSGIASGEAFGTPTVTLGVAGVVAYPTGSDVAAFMGTGDPNVVAVAEIHVGVITQFALVYTRGNGFYVDGLAEPIAGVVLAATARLVGNPEQLDIQIGSTRRASFFKGWSLAEQRVLNNYRGVAT